jgi:hypothetical protein
MPSIRAKRLILLHLAAALCSRVAAAGVSAAVPIPDGFPTFTVPGQESEMRALRELFAMHYPNSGPKPTLWDEWLAPAALWPAVTEDVQADALRKQWGAALSARVQEADGYIATHQHANIAYTNGWPFPMWTAGEGGWGWHFSFKNTVTPPFRPGTLNTPDDWKRIGVEDRGVDGDGWNVTLTKRNAAIVTPMAPIGPIDTFQAPFLQLRWRGTGLERLQPYIEWDSAERPGFGPGRRVYFAPAAPGTANPRSTMTYSLVTMYTHPLWKGRVTHLRIGFGNPEPGAKITVQALMTCYDSRQNVNSQSFIHACADYFRWTGDKNFLRTNLPRMRLALRHLMVVHHGLEKNFILTTWPGHDGRSAIVRGKDGKKSIRYGQGIGNNYWDLLPFGWKDAYATIRYYDSLRVMAGIERDVSNHPEWNMPREYASDPAFLLRHAAAVKRTGNAVFWNATTGRFLACIDADGHGHDYGYTFLNNEAIFYDFASPEHARSIEAWLHGERTVAGDTSTGTDIYHWRFGPRSSTKRNIDWYTFVWKEPEKIPWGGQVQDGGAVLGFSYHDIMARLRTRGPDDAAKRLSAIADWFAEVRKAGGYRAYYADHDGTLQGGGTAGGLGVDVEFYESVLVPQVMLDGFLGFAPTADGFRLAPRLPSRWPSLTIDRIRYRDMVLSITATKGDLEIRAEGRPEAPLWLNLPPGAWSQVVPGAAARPLLRRASDGAVEVTWPVSGVARLVRRMNSAAIPARMSAEADDLPSLRLSASAGTGNEIAADLIRRTEPNHE